MRWWLWLLLLFVLTPFAHAQEPWRDDIDRANGQRVQTSYQMPVEACYVNQTLEPDPKSRIITLWNRTAYGMVIRKIRSYAYIGGVAISDTTTHRPASFLYIMDALADGEPILRGALSTIPSAARPDRRISVLRPGESCQMWVPFPELDAWMVVLERVEVASGGIYTDTLRHCMGTAFGRPVDCLLRLDTVTYLPVERLPYSETLVKESRRYDILMSNHWMPRIL